MSSSLILPKLIVTLSRGEIQVIGATTFKEYRKYIEKDSALERRFQPVTVSEPTVADTITVLKGIKQYYENFHRVKISDDMLRECAVLSERYINDRFLPDKAIDLLDEACACTSIRTPEIEEFDALNEELKKHEKLVEDYEQKSDPDYEIIAKEKGEILRIQNRLKEVEETLKNVQVTEAQVPKNVLGSGRTLAIHMYMLSSEGLYMNQAYATAVILLVLVVAINTLSGVVAKKLTKA